MDALHAVLKWFDYNRYLVIGLIVAGLLSVGLVGCQPTTYSLLTPGEKVTAVELEREVAVVAAGFEKQKAALAAQTAALNADIQASNAITTAAQTDLQEQAEFNAGVIEVVGAAGIALTEGTLTSAGGLAAVLQILTMCGWIGSRADSKRKDTVIAIKSGA